jgi:hypothetical protein
MKFSDSWIGYHVVRAVLGRRLLEQLQASRGSGFLSHLRIARSAPYFFAYYVWVRLLRLFSVERGRLRMLDFLKTYLWWHMRCRGVDSYVTRSEPEYQGKGMLIFSVRQDPMQSLLLLQQFSYPVIVPVVPNVYRFPFSLLLPWRGIGRELQVTTYTDHGLDSDTDTILALLGAGYPVVVYLNLGYISPPDTPNAPIYGGVTRLLQWDGPQYAVTVEGMHLYPSVTAVDPYTMRVNMVPMSELVADFSAPTRTNKLARLMQFLGFHEYHFVSEPWVEGGSVGATVKPGAQAPRGDVR